MKILALDSTADVGTVALCEDKKLIAQITVNTGNTHSETLLPSVESALKLAGVPINDIDLFACSTGPGSFTGVRIGVATIKGLAYGKNKPCASISTLDALARNLLGFDGIICPVMNARRSQVYNALFECRGGEIKRLCPDRAISIEELDGELSQIDDKIYLCGDGYSITEANLKKTKIENIPYPLRLTNAYSVALSAIEKCEKGDLLTDSTLVPIYLRPSQAERERLERLEKEKI